MKKSNWKTTLCGCVVALLGVGAKFFPQYSDILTPLAASCVALGLYFAADGSNLPPTSPA